MFSVLVYSTCLYTKANTWLERARDFGSQPFKLFHIFLDRGILVIVGVLLDTSCLPTSVNLPPIPLGYVFKFELVFLPNDFLTIPLQRFRGYLITFLFIPILKPYYCNLFSIIKHFCVFLQNTSAAGCNPKGRLVKQQIPNGVLKALTCKMVCFSSFLEDTAGALIKHPVWSSFWHFVFQQDF